MRLPVYATVAQLKPHAMQMGKGDLDRLEEYLPAASRMIDEICGAPRGYFGAAGSTVYERKFRGNGTQYLRVDPYRPDSISFVEYDTLYEFTPDYSEKVDDKGTHWLITCRGEIWCEDVVKISACWGFEEIPDDISQATVELAILMWRQRDPALTKVQIDVNGTLIKPEDFPPRVRAICAAWKKKRPVLIN